MVRAVNEFACEWCGLGGFGFHADAWRHEGECIKGANRAELVGAIVETKRKHWLAEAEGFRKRLALYDRLAKAHGIEQEKPNGEA